MDAPVNLVYDPATTVDTWKDEEAVWVKLQREGTIKGNKLKLVQAWIIIHQDELMADWELASQGQSIFKIDPLK